MFIKAKSLRKPEPTILSDAIQNWLKINHLEEKFSLTEIREAWPEIVGTVIARHTQSVRVENKILKIQVDNAPLRQQLNLSKARLIKLVNEKAGRQLVVECLVF
jgi:predicted nucleic acid-binding Zn ribbon protein